MTKFSCLAAVLCAAAFGAGYGLSRLFRLNEAEQLSLMYGLGMNNNGTGLVLASLALVSYPRVMVPIIFYNVVQHLFAGGLHEMIGRTMADEKPENTSATAPWRQKPQRP